jgi:threonylcarbamoyladenosine tRNA methylthiotransferase MtaB
LYGPEFMFLDQNKSPERGFLHLMPKTYKIYTLGCKVNQYDSSKVALDLEQLGFQKAEVQADLAIINTCTVTHSAIAKDKKMLEQARRENPAAKIAIVGCMPVNYREETERLGVDYIYGAAELDKFVAQIQKEVEAEGGVSCEIDLPKFKADKSRYFLKIQDGCQQFCSYCIIAYNRGKLSSREKDGIIEEIKNVTGQGVAEVVLCGIHLGLYGVDKAGAQYHLIDLLKELFQIETLKKVRLSSIEITEVNDEIIELMKANRKFSRHLHIPLQAGSDGILKSMNRPYDKEYFSERISRLRQAVPEVAITTDVIVGFPGETESCFEETLAYCREIGFSKIHVFPFSAHEKTPAFSFPDQLSESIKKRRASELQKLGDELEKKYNESFLGQEIEVVVDGRSEGENYRGKSEYYFDVRFQSSDKLKVGELVTIKNWQLI